MRIIPIKVEIGTHLSVLSPIAIIGTDEFYIKEIINEHPTSRVPGLKMSSYQDLKRGVGEGSITIGRTSKRFRKPTKTISTSDFFSFYTML